MSNDLIIKRGSESLYSSKLDNLVGNGAVLATSGFAIGIPSKITSIFLKNNIPATAQKVLKTTSKFGIFAGVLGLAAIGSAYFLWDSVSDEDIKKQTNIVENNNNNPETPLLNIVQSQKLFWLRIKKDIQQSIYSLLGWRE